jgi:hypothetical protein
MMGSDEYAHLPKKSEEAQASVVAVETSERLEESLVQDLLRRSNESSIGCEWGS